MKLTITIGGATNITVDEDEKVLELLEQVQGKLNQLLTKEDELMSKVAQDFEALRVAIDDATNQVAARIGELTGRISNSMSQQEVDTLKAEFHAQADRLNALAQDPNNPVPPVTV